MAKLPDHPAMPSSPRGGHCRMVSILEFDGQKIEVVTLFNVYNQCRALRPPSQEFLCLLARRRVVSRHKGGEEAEVGTRVRSLDADNRQLQLSADSLSDIPERYALLAGSMQSRTSRGGFRGQPEQARRIESMHGRPAVRSIADEG